MLARSILGRMRTFEETGAAFHGRGPGKVLNGASSGNTALCRPQGRTAEVDPDPAVEREERRRRLGNGLWVWKGGRSVLARGDAIGVGGPAQGGVVGDEAFAVEVIKAIVH